VVLRLQSDKDVFTFWDGMVPKWVDDIFNEADPLPFPSQHLLQLGVLVDSPLHECWREAAPSPAMEAWLVMWRLGR
jgi:hypothetical protein